MRVRIGTARTLIGLAAWALLWVGCGARAPIPAVEDDDPELAGLPSVGPPALQLYAVLTADPTAMQAEPDVKSMFSAARGDLPEYRSIRRLIRWIPSTYALDITLDFADLPHPQFAAKRLAPLLKSLPEGARRGAREARLAVVLRSEASVLPSRGHLRLAGSAALYVAERYDGIVLDLLTRRAYTAAAWRRVLSAPEWPSQQRVVATVRGDRVRLRSRGLPRLGLPDLVLFTPTASLTAARARFDAALRAMERAGEAQPGSVLKGEGMVFTLRRCAKAGGFDAGCVQLDP